ncbi:RNA dependent RNA polymerase [Yam virus X]|uniref:RNA replication protein n=3 Tax=Yam virus X TaxID=1503864 RepID=A0A096XMB6_9VIRU|nr:RNA dependent RNA polymerase [Yam virus X]AIB00369.1 RNA dependent RNA polymerase [Yam virus X]
MANVRAALERFTDPSIKSALQEQCFTEVRSTLRSVSNLNPYSHDVSTSDSLEKLGIATNPFSIATHTHGAAKAVENRMLNILGAQLPKTPCTFLWIKKAKKNLLMRSSTHDTFLNMPIEPKDFARYEEETIVSKLSGITDKTVVISDALHFLKPSFLWALFKGNPTVTDVYATMVLPAEALHKHPSMNPDIYNINYDFNGFQYIPGAHAGGAYHHEFSSLDWLKYGHIHYDNGKTKEYITCQLIESLGANHLFLFRRGFFLTPRVRTFSLDEYVILPQIFHPKQMNASRPIKFTLANQLLLYVKSIKSPTQRDIFAKLRQLIKTSELNRYAPDELIHISNFFLFISELSAESCYDNLLTMGFFKRCTVPVKNAFLELYRKLFGKLEFEQLIAALDWKTFSYSLEVIDKKIIRYSYLEEVRKEGYTTFNTNFNGLWDIIEKPEQTDSELTAEPKPHTELREKVEEIIEEKAQASIEMKVAGNILTATERDWNKSQMEKIYKLVNDPLSFCQLSKEMVQCLSEMALVGCSQSPWKAWETILKSLGFKANQIQLTPDNLLILPIENIRKVNKTASFPLNFPSRLAKLLTDCKFCLTKINLNSARASAYASDLKNSRTGALLRNQPFEWKTALAARCENTIRSDFTGMVIHGAGGCGKSRLFQNFLKSSTKTDRLFTVVCPTVALLMDWRNKVPHLPLETFKTFEKAMLQPSNPFVIFDDYTRLPEGFIEAFLIQHPNVEIAFLTGDPRQAEFHETNPEAYINQLSKACDVFSPYCSYYINATHRNCRTLANALGVYSEVDTELKISHSSHVSDGIPVICPSHLKSEAIQELGRKSMTYAGCQGLTAPKVQILLDTNTPLCSTKVMYTALSRAVDEIRFVNSGSNSTDFWNKLSCTPYLKTFINAVREPNKTNSEAPESVIREPLCKTHFPVENTTTILEKEVSQLVDKHEREIYNDQLGHSNAIQTEDTIVQLFQHQQAKDETLYRATIDKRIKLSSEEANLRELVLKKDIGDILFMNYKKAMNLPEDPIPFEQDLWTACEAEVQSTYLSKPVHMLMNGQLRQSPDFDPHAIQLFLKSQWVKKVDCIGILKVKAGQTIASFMQETVMLFGTMARYMRRMRDRYQPRNILINCEKNPVQITDWIMDGWRFDRPAYANDFTAFDQSQDGAMLQFEVIKAKFHSIPEEIIDAYIAIKLNSKIFLGTLAIMRLTGEGPTFDANTECNIAFHFTKFQVAEDTRLMFAGDDMAQDAPAVMKSSFVELQDKLALTSKPIVYSQAPGDFAQFCGNLITPLGLLKEPRKLNASLQLAKNLGNENNVAAAYANDLFYSYAQGDRLFDVLSEEEMTHHAAATRFLVKGFRHTFKAPDSDDEDDGTKDLVSRLELEGHNTF